MRLNWRANLISYPFITYFNNNRPEEFFSHAANQQKKEEARHQFLAGLFFIQKVKLYGLLGLNRVHLHLLTKGVPVDSQDTASVNLVSTSTTKNLGQKWLFNFAED